MVSNSVKEEYKSTFHKFLKVENEYHDCIHKIISSEIKKHRGKFEFEPILWITNQMDLEDGCNLCKVILNEHDCIVCVDENGEEYSSLDFYMNDYWVFLAMIVDDYILKD